MVVNSNKTLCPSQFQLLHLPIGSKLPIELTNPLGKVSSTRIGDKVGFSRSPSKEFGEITIVEDGYTFKLDSDSEEIVEAYEYLQERVNKGCWVRFALPDDRSTWWVWQEKPWSYGKNSKIFYITPFDP